MWSWNRPNSGETNRNITLTLKGKFGDDFLLSRQLKYRPSLQGYSSTHKCMITDSWESRLYAEPHLLATFLSPTIFHSKEPIPSPKEQQSPLKTWFIPVVPIKTSLDTTIVKHTVLVGDAVQVLFDCQSSFRDVHNWFSP